MAPADVLSTMPAKLSLTWGHAVAGLILVAILRALYYRVRAMRSPLNKLPGAPPYSMIFGDFPKVAGQPTGTIAQMNTKLFGHTYRTSNGIFSLPGVVTSDLAALGYIQRNSDMFIKPPVQARMLKNLAGNGVLMAEHDVHRRQRRILNPAFSPAAIREMIPIFYAKAYELRDRIAATIEEDTQHNASPTPPKPEDIIPGSRKLDMGKYLTEYAFDVIGMAGFDYDFGCLHTPNPVVQGFRDALSGLMRITPLAIIQHLWPIFDAIPSKRQNTVHASLARTMAIGHELVAQKKREVLAAAEGSVEKSSVMGKDLLSLIVKANLAHDIPANQRLSDEEIVYQVSTFLLAGSETTSNGTSWCLWRLAQDPALQQRLRNELNTVPGTEPTIEELNLLPLLDNVVRETLRLDSPVPETIRAATVDCNLPLSKPIYGNDGNIVFTDSIPLQKGAFLIESFNVVHRNQEIWGEDADIFNPDRYDRPNCPALKVPGSWGNLVAFNGGTRNCIGYRFALAEMKTVLFVLLRNFTFELLPSNPEITRKSFIVMLPWVVGEEYAGAQMPLMVRSIHE